MKDECLICGAPLVYLKTGVEMECAICHRKESSKTRCGKGHYICNDCHTRGIDTVVGICLGTDLRDPWKIYELIVSREFCHMHGPEHHIIVGAALLTAYKNCGGDVDLPAALAEMQERGRMVPGGACGFWGACGAGISAGMFVSVATGSTPLAGKEWGLSNLMTSAALHAIGEVGGPRCCKRKSYLAIIEAVRFARDELGVEMELSPIVCVHYKKNNQCIGSRCPFRKAAE